MLVYASWGSIMTLNYVFFIFFLPSAAFLIHTNFFALSRDYNTLQDKLH